MSEAQKRLHTLLTDRAIAGLDRGEQEEFDHLRAGATVDSSYELAAAAIELGLMGHATPMPLALLGTVLEQAGRYWGYTEARPHDPTRGGKLREPTGDFILGDDGDVLLPGDDPTPVQRLWEASPRFGFDESLELGVLESSLTDGRVERASKRGSERHAAAAAVEPSKRESSKPRERESSKPREQSSGPSEAFEASKPASKRKPKREPEPEPSEAPTHVEAGEPISAVVRMPVGESVLVRVLTYASAIAALIMLLLAVWLYAHRHDPPDPETLEQQLEGADDKLEWEFVPRSDPALAERASGSVTWSSTLQVGVLTLSGLAVNDPAESQYQLWIVDKQREGPPVDGGVFDIEADEGQQRVRVDAKLVVGEPGAFLITVERPGGVVVSQQERLLLVAAGTGE